MPRWIVTTEEIGEQGVDDFSQTIVIADDIGEALKKVLKDGTLISSVWGITSFERGRSRHSNRINRIANKLSKRKRGGM